MANHFIEVLPKLSDRGKSTNVMHWTCFSFMKPLPNLTCSQWKILKAIQWMSFFNHLMLFKQQHPILKQHFLHLCIFQLPISTQNSLEWPDVTSCQQEAISDFQVAIPSEQQWKNFASQFQYLPISLCNCHVFSKKAETNVKEKVDIYDT